MDVASVRQTIVGLGRCGEKSTYGGKCTQAACAFLQVIEIAANATALRARRARKPLKL
jgi:hypothetical protein